MSNQVGFQEQNFSSYFVHCLDRFKLVPKKIGANEYSALFKELGDLFKQIQDPAKKWKAEVLLDRVGFPLLGILSVSQAVFSADKPSLPFLDEFIDSNHQFLNEGKLTKILFRGIQSGERDSKILCMEQLTKQVARGFGFQAAEMIVIKSLNSADELIKCRCVTLLHHLVSKGQALDTGVLFAKECQKQSKLTYSALILYQLLVAHGRFVSEATEAAYCAIKSEDNITVRLGVFIFNNLLTIGKRKEVWEALEYLDLRFNCPGFDQAVEIYADFKSKVLASVMSFPF